MGCSVGVLSERCPCYLYPRPRVMESRRVFAAMLLQILLPVTYSHAMNALTGVKWTALKSVVLTWYASRIVTLMVATVLIA